MKIADVQALLTEAKYFKGAINGKASGVFLKAVDNIVSRNESKLYGPRTRFNQERLINAAGQLVLNAMGYYVPGNIDGWAGPKTAGALQEWLDLKSGARVVPLLPIVVFEINPKFDAESAARVKKCLPGMQKLLNAARDKIEFYVSDSTRGRKAQEDAFRRKASKARFGQSAHNYSPALAVDLWPKKNVDWNDIQAFKAIQKVIGWFNPKTGKGAGLAFALKIGTRWGGDWNMDGKDTDGWDLPHYEQHPWRDYVNQTKLFEG